MRASINLGRVGGVPVGLNISVLVIVAILVVGLGFGRFPVEYPGLPLAVYLLAAVVTALLFLASLLAHELAHALVARRHGIGVSGITLWLLGGVAQLTGEARTPGADLRIAAVGPATSLAAAALFGLVAWRLGAAGSAAGHRHVRLPGHRQRAARGVQPDPGGAAGRRPGAARGAVGAVGRPGAAPRSPRRAPGRAFGSRSSCSGSCSLFTGPAFQGLWLALIGWFLVNAASAEEQQARLGAALHGIRVGDVMSRSPVTAAPDRDRRRAHRPGGDAGAAVHLPARGRVRRLPRPRHPQPHPRGAARQRPLTLLADIACPPGEVPVRPSRRRPRST